MLHELRVENLLLIERAELGLGPGLNVLTGETGAGKTVLAHALDLLLGGKPRPGIVRPGASEAYVEGVFALPAALRESSADRLPEDADELVLARRVSAEGRTRAYVGGRSATAGDLRGLGGALLSFYGQHEHRRLTLASAQLEILDGFCGPEQAGAPRGVRRPPTRASGAGARSWRSCGTAPARATARSTCWSGSSRRSTARGPTRPRRPRWSPSASGCATLPRCWRRGRRRRASRVGEGDGGAARRSRARRARSRRCAGVDPALDVLADRVAALAVEADDVAGELRRYGEARRGGARPARRGRGAPRAAATGSSASTAARSRPCSRTPRRAAPARRAGGAEEALEAGEARLAAAARSWPSAAGPARGAGRRRRAGRRGRERLAGLAMDGATFEARVSRATATGRRAATRSSS